MAYEENYQAELDRLLREYEEMKSRHSDIQADVDNEATVMSMRSPAQVEKERQLRQIFANMRTAQRMKALQELYNNQHREQTTVAGKVTIDTLDLDFILADSLQRIESRENPKAEYYDWVEAQNRIETDLNTDGATQPEVDARNNFIDFLDDRETEMKRVIALYLSASVNSKGYYQEMAKEQLHFMRFKLSELRRLRTRTEATTNRADQKEREAANLNTSAKILSAAAGAEIMTNNYSNTVAGKMNNYIDRRFEGEEFENSVAGRIFHQRPDTENEKESQERIEKAQEFSGRVAEALLIVGMRMGMSKEAQQDRREANRRKIEEIRQRRFVGFQKEIFLRNSGRSMDY